MTYFGLFGAPGIVNPLHLQAVPDFGSYAVGGGSHLNLGALGGTLNRDPCSLWRVLPRHIVGIYKDYIWGI